VKQARRGHSPRPSQPCGSGCAYEWLPWTCSCEQASRSQAPRRTPQHVDVAGLICGLGWSLLWRERVAESAAAAGADTEPGPGLGRAPRRARRNPFPLTHTVDGGREPTGGARADSGCAGHPGWRHTRFDDAHDSGWDGAAPLLSRATVLAPERLDQRVDASAAGCGRARTGQPIMGVHTASGAPLSCSRTPSTPCVRRHRMREATGCSTLIHCSWAARTRPGGPSVSRETSTLPAIPGPRREAASVPYSEP
jgi:hypothetical protein